MIRKYPIRYRLLSSFILISILPIFITGLLLYNKSSDAIHEKIEYYALEILNQVGQNIEQELQRLEYDSIEIMFSDDVQQLLTNYSELSEWEVMKIEEKLQNQLVNKFSFLHDISDVQIYTNEGDKIVAYGDLGSNILNYNEELLNTMISSAKELMGKPLWYSTNIHQEVHKVDLIVNKNDLREGVVLIRSIRSRETLEIIGTLMMRTNEAYFSKIYQNMDLDKQKLLVINQEGLIISTNVSQWVVGEMLDAPELISELKNSDDSLQGFLDHHYDDNLIFYKKSNVTDWTMISFTPVTYLYEETHSILIYSLIVGLIAGFLAIVLEIFIASSIFVPLENMIVKMKDVQNGDLTVRIDDDANDELAVVADHFNEMIYNLEQQLEEIKRKEKEKRTYEFQALQAQVNPHFLSNTLNSIKWLAGIQGAENIENLITSLIELLHEAMVKDTIFIQVKQEIAYLEHYLNIQSFRYFDKFQVKIEVDSGISDFYIPKFLLQPVVENAIIHGFSNEKAQGIISIKAWLEEEKMHFIITDNGAGMTEEQIEQVMKNRQPEKGTFNGIGLVNVLERMDMYYNKDASFSIESVKDVFTRVEIILRTIKEEELDGYL